jgi:hypothetical protein
MLLFQAVHSHSSLRTTNRRRCPGLLTTFIRRGTWSNDGVESKDDGRGADVVLGTTADDDAARTGPAVWSWTSSWASTWASTWASHLFSSEVVQLQASITRPNVPKANVFKTV